MAVLRLRDKCWELGKRTYIMGILNLTPDSFSDGGQFATASAAGDAARSMMEEGADIIDIGGQSTRPGNTPISAEEELGRIKETVDILSRDGIPFSVDTFFPMVAEYCLEKGCLMINDVSGKVTCEMAETVKKYKAAWILMHNRDITQEADAVKIVRKKLEDMAAEAIMLGVEKDRLCLDPGIGFGKTNDQSIALIEGTKDSRPEGFAFLTAASRKRCIGQMSGIADPQDRDEATAVAHGIAIKGGTDIIRVHNVAVAVRAAAEADALYRR